MQGMLVMIPIVNAMPIKHDCNHDRAFASSLLHWPVPILQPSVQPAEITGSPEALMILSFLYASFEGLGRAPFLEAALVCPELPLLEAAGIYPKRALLSCIRCTEDVETC